jgi:hypothetical protein
MSPIEAQISRLKTLKRMMHGGTGFVSASEKGSPRAANP